MAVRAMQAQLEREVEVEREKLVAVLKANRAQHLKDYQESLNSYKAIALDKLDKAVVSAKEKLLKNAELVRTRINEFNPDDKEYSDYLSLVDAMNIHLKVPQNYSKQYDAAIQMAEWDVNKTMKLKYSEFVCFVLDEWDWKSDFEVTNTMYKSMSIGRSLE